MDRGEFLSIAAPLTAAIIQPLAHLRFACGPSVTYTHLENRQTQSNYVLISRLRTAVYTTRTTSCNLGASPTIPKPNPALPPLAAGGAGTNAGPGCVPVNIFGADGSILPNQVPYLTAAAGTSQETSLAQARALLTGDLGFTIPSASDPIGFALGAEYRKYKARPVSYTHLDVYKRQIGAWRDRNPMPAQRLRSVPS